MLLDLDKIGNLIHKLQERHRFLVEQENLTALDRDALLAVLREMYDVCLTEVENKVPIATPKVEPVAPVSKPVIEESPAVEIVKEEPVTRAVEEEKPKRKKPTLIFTHIAKEKPVEVTKEESKVTPPTPKEEPVKVVPPPPVEVVKEEPVEVTKEEIVEQASVKVIPPVPTPPPVPHTPKVQDTKPKVVEPSVLRQPRKEEKKPEVVEVSEDNSDKFNPDYEELFLFKTATDLSQKIGESSINNLWHAISINERFLYINQLFGESMDVFKGSIDKLHAEANFDDARLYLESELIGKYEWTNKQRKLFAKDFIKLVRRLYIGK